MVATQINFTGHFMKAIWNGQLLAESNDTVVVENNHYFPLSALNMAYFSASQHETVCSWKGTASYYSITVGDQTNPNAAWFYKEPKAAAKQIQGRVAFWKGVQVVAD
jgi:uncharacterized protein (DUF427 family)